MAFTIRQGLEARDSVMCVFDPCPVVLYESNISALYRFRYTLQIFERVGGDWIKIAEVKRYPNNSNVGVFDMGPILRNALTIEEFSTEPYATGKATSTTGTSAPFRVVVGYESATTEDGPVSATTGATTYVWAIAGRMLDEFTSWNNTPMTNYVMDSGPNEGKWLTLRNTSDITAIGSQFSDAVVVPLNVDERFTISYLSTDVAAGFNTDAMKLRMRYGSATTTIATSDLNISNQEVDVTTYYGINVEGSVVRDLHVGPKDLEDATWATFDITRWDYIVIELLKQSDSTRVSQPLVLVRNECKQLGVRFKFMNNLGGYDYLQCLGHASQVSNYTREQYSVSTGNWYTADGLSNDTNLLLNDPSKRRIVSNVTNETRKITTHTGYLDSTMNDLVHGLMSSKRVYATEFDKPRSTEKYTYHPANITSSSMKAMFQEVDKLIEYSIDFEYGNPLRPLV